MDSPLNIGDTTTALILNHLSETHLSMELSVHAAVYSGTKFIQLTLAMKHRVVVLRRVQDSYINVSQLFAILREAGSYSQPQIDSVLANEVLSSSQYKGHANQFLDLRSHDNQYIRGIWIPYDKAVTLALRFDIYAIAKKLFLVDVHDFDSLPSQKDPLPDHPDPIDRSERLMGSPAKRHKRDTQHLQLRVMRVPPNPNYPYTLPVVTEVDSDVAGELKAALGAVFKRDEAAQSGADAKDGDDETSWNVSEATAVFSPILARHTRSAVADVPLDSKGQTALHFAATLASPILVEAFVELGLALPIRGNTAGESPLVVAVRVTNAMERGTFAELLLRWLYPCLVLFDNSHRSILHHLAEQAATKPDSARFYMAKVLEHVLGDARALRDMVHTVVGAAQDRTGDTALHIAAELGSRWMVCALLALRADPSAVNARGVRPNDYDIVKDAVRDPMTNHVFELVRTAVEFLDQRLAETGDIGEEEGPESTGDDQLENANEKLENSRDEKSVGKEGSEADGVASCDSGRIFQSIQELLSNTNSEYETILRAKRQHIRALNATLRDATIVTANNRFLASKVHERLVHLENLKLQMANLTEKLGDDDGEGNNDEDIDAQYVIEPLYERISKDEPVDDLKNDAEFMLSLQPVSILKARVASYKRFNDAIEAEVARLVDYSALKAKFKKVVSICTGVGIDEIDGLLDGLLEAVEGQQ